MEHSREYIAHINSPEWKATRRAVLARAGGRCEHCGEAGPLDVHHKDYHTLGHERLADLVALCPDCHFDADRARER